MNWFGVEYGYGTSTEPPTENKLSNFPQQMESLIERVESSETPRSEADILPGFPKRSVVKSFFATRTTSTPMVFTQENILTKTTFSRRIWHPSVWRIMTPQFDRITCPNDILVSGFNFGCGSSREQAATAILARQIPLAVAGRVASGISSPE